MKYIIMLPDDRAQIIEADSFEIVPPGIAYFYRGKSTIAVIKNWNSISEMKEPAVE